MLILMTPNIPYDYYNPCNFSSHHAPISILKHVAHVT